MSELVTLSESELLDYFTDLSNWGRWGKDDQRGTLNLLSDEQTLNATRLVREGLVIGCARPLAPRPSKMPTLAMLHMMTSSGEAIPEHGMASGTDWIGIGLHGFEFTHVDALAHVFWNGAMYNGHPAGMCSTERGALACGVEPLFGGVAGRGLLVDGPTLRSCDWLGPSEGLVPEELDKWFASVGVEPKPGDFLFVRTGRDRREAAGDTEISQETLPGLDPRCLPWLHAHDISVLVSDVIHDRLPSGFEQVPFPIHCVGIVAMGLWLVDNAALDALAEACLVRERFEFLTTLAPDPIRRATGSLVNPLALF